MHFLGLVTLNPLGQSSSIVHMRPCLQAFLQLRNTSLNRVKHLPGLATSIAENDEPSVLVEFLSHSLSILLQLFVARFQLNAPAF